MSTQHNFLLKHIHGARQIWYVEASLTVFSFLDPYKSSLKAGNKIANLVLFY